VYGSDRRARVAACHHEAAHAIVCRALGGTVRRIVVETDCSGACHVGTWPAALVDRLAVFYAGECGRYFYRFCDDADNGTGGDAAAIETLTAHLAPAARAETLTAAEATARRIVETHLDTLTHLAQALDAVGELSARQVDDVFQQYGL
jgi:hypothetical protein